MSGSMKNMTMSDGKTVGVYHATPYGVRKGGLVVIQEIFGITSHIKEVCDSYCAEGYEVMAPSLFDREEPGLNIAADEMQLPVGADVHRAPHRLVRKSDRLHPSDPAVRAPRELQAGVRC